ncbi:conserved hypothetical protein [Trichinella spiralis]|uniref:hypothetical protein n=1 Tax=Trichinella spiralis TaxID=6334 RepID=UPI0001EFE11D|nr:conserved hypothetical protein [Trichinella spiralis]
MTQFKKKKLLTFTRTVIFHGCTASSAYISCNNPIGYCLEEFKIAMVEQPVENMICEEQKADKRLIEIHKSLKEKAKITKNLFGNSMHAISLGFTEKLTGTRPSHISFITAESCI